MKKIKKIKINLNGKLISLFTGTSVYKLIKKIKVHPNKIAIELNKRGFGLARRTITKYRKKNNIPSSRHR